MNQQRIQKRIAAAGLCSRRRAEELIRAGRVTLNGTVAALGAVAGPEDEILVDGVPLAPAPETHTTLLLYKPRGVVTTLSDQRGRPTVAQLLPPDLPRLYPVGRLDQFSEGLLLMTDDGELAHRLTHPKGEVNKVYHLWVARWRPEALELLRRPIVLDGYRIQPPGVKLLWAHARPSGEREESLPPDAGGERRPGPSTPPRPPRDESSENGAPSCTACLEITIHEGRNRQIRRMAQAAGLTPTRLKRIAEGPLRLGELKPGQWRRLTEAELSQLKIEN